MSIVEYSQNVRASIRSLLTLYNKILFDLAMRSQRLDPVNPVFFLRTIRRKYFFVLVCSICVMSEFSGFTVWQYIRAQFALENIFLYLTYLAIFLPLFILWLVSVFRRIKHEVFSLSVRDSIKKKVRLVKTFVTMMSNIPQFSGDRELKGSLDHLGEFERSIPKQDLATLATSLITIGSTAVIQSIFFGVVSSDIWHLFLNEFYTLANISVYVAFGYFVLTVVIGGSIGLYIIVVPLVIGIYEGMKYHDQYIVEAEAPLDNLMRSIPISEV